MADFNSYKSTLNSSEEAKSFELKRLLTETEKRVRGILDHQALLGAYRRTIIMIRKQEIPNSLIDFKIQETSLEQDVYHNLKSFESLWKEIKIELGVKEFKTPGFAFPT